MPTGVIDHGSSRSGRWLEVRRTRLALWIGGIEGLVVWASRGAHLMTIVALAVIAAAAVFAHGYATTQSRSDVVKHAAWVAAASQVLATVIVTLAFLLFWAFVTAIVVAAAVALVFLFVDRRE